MRLRVVIVSVVFAAACGGVSDKPSTGGAQATGVALPDEQQTLTVATPGGAAPTEHPAAMAATAWTRR